jgi:hypothetical protein
VQLLGDGDEVAEMAELQRDALRQWTNNCRVSVDRKKDLDVNDRRA